MNSIFIKIGDEEYNVDSVTFPDNRTFRGAWSINTEQSVVYVDMDIARDIWRDKIRQARIGKLEALDAQFMKALETGADTTEIVAQKQALRDAPADPAINAATTPEELKLVQPAGLTVE